MIEEKVGNRFELLDRGVAEQDGVAQALNPIINKLDLKKVKSFYMSKDTTGAYRVAKDLYI